MIEVVVNELYFLFILFISRKILRSSFEVGLKLIFGIFFWNFINKLTYLGNY